MYPDIPVFLPIENLTFGLDRGQLVELRFEVALQGGQRVLLRLRGTEQVTKTLQKLGARSDNDVRQAYVCYNVNKPLHLLTISEDSLMTPVQAITALKLHAARARMAGMNIIASQAEEQAKDLSNRILIA